MTNEFQQQYPFRAATIKKQHRASIQKVLLPSRQLICPARFDFMAKLLFLDSTKKVFDSKRGLEIYQKHLLAFNGGKIREPGNFKKNSLEKYILTFLSIYQSILEMPSEENCFFQLPLPVTRSLMAIDGSHRICSAISTGHSLWVYHLENYEAPYCYDYRFFRHRFLDESILLEMALKYNEQKSLALIRVVFSQKPKSGRIRLLEKRLCHSRSIVYFLQSQDTLFVLLDSDYAALKTIQDEIECEFSAHVSCTPFLNKAEIEQQLKGLLPALLTKEKKRSFFQNAKKTALYAIITMKALVKEALLSPVLSQQEVSDDNSKF